MLGLAQMVAMLLTLEAPSDPFAHCRRLAAAAPETYETARCYYSAGSRSARWPTAMNELEHIFARTESPWTALVLAFISTVRRTPRAHEHYQRAISGFTATEDARGESIARLNLSALYLKSGKTQAAEREAARAEALALPLGDEELILKTLIARLRVQVRTGRDLERAYVQLRQHPRLADAPRPLRSAGLNLLGNAALSLGRYTTANAHYRELARLHTREGGSLHQLAAARFNLANSLLEEARLLPSTSKRQAVLRAAEEARAMARRAGARSTEVAALAVLGELRMAEGDPRGARRELERCAELAEALELTSRSGECLGYLAEVVAREESLASAVRLLERAEARVSEGDNPNYRASVARLRSQVLFAGGRFPEAVDAGLTTLDRIEDVRLRQGSPVGRSGILARWYDDYHRLSGRLHQAYRDEGAASNLGLGFRVSERLRAQVLLERLEALGILRSAPKIATSRRAPVDLEGLRRVLAENEALLSFQVGLKTDLAGRKAGGAWVTSVTRHEVRLHPIPDRTSLARTVPMLAGLLRGRDARERRPSAALYRSIVGDALAELPREIEHLLVVPDGPLHELPFAVLRETASAAPLGVTHKLSITPSATILARGRELHPAERPGRVWVIADATPDAPLPYARREAAWITDAVGRGSLSLVGREASEARLKAGRLGRFSVLHFATHAQLSSKADPTTSRAPSSGPAIMLAPGDGEDGRLEPDEIAALDLRGAVVVLGACDTAAGEWVRGEGVLSLARAFFSAGAVAVVGSRLEIRDDEAAQFDRRLYRALLRGASVAEAVRRARAQSWSDRRPAEAWGGIVVYGDGAVIPFSPSPWRLPLVAVGIGIVSALCLLACAIAHLRPVRSVRRRSPR